MHVLYGAGFLHLLVSAGTPTRIVITSSGSYSNNPELSTVPPVMEQGSEWSELWSPHYCFPIRSVTKWSLDVSEIRTDEQTCSLVFWIELLLVGDLTVLFFRIYNDEYRSNLKRDTRVHLAMFTDDCAAAIWKSECKCGISHWKVRCSVTRAWIVSLWFLSDCYVFLLHISHTFPPDYPNK